LEVQAWGWGIALSKTTCNTSYGYESANYGTTTPEQILDDIIANHIKKRWGGANTNWDIDGTDIDAPHADLSITNITSNYLDNFTLISRLCDLINAHAVIDSDISVHWYVDTDGHFRMKEIDADSADATWKRYYGGNAGAATFKEGVNDVLARGFHKQIDDYANHVIVAAGFRKPPWDIWCNDGGPSWGNYQSTESYSIAQYIVGGSSLKIVPTIDNDPAVVFRVPTHDAGWNFTKCGSPKTIPHVNFYIFATDVDALTTGTGLVLGKDWTGVVDASGNDIKYAMDFSTLIANPQANKWFHVSVPMGPYWAMAPELANCDAEWIETAVGGTPSWSNIDFVAIGFAGIPTTEAVYIDDFHFSGAIVRSCYDTSEITATNRERQIFLRMDSAVDDTLIADDDDAGAAAMVAISELFRRKATPITGYLSFPCIEDMLPGQTLQVYAGLKSDLATYRWSNLPMRVKELVHRIDANGYKTTVEVTSDVTNTFTTGVPSMWDLLMDSTGALGHGQAKDLKNSGVDNLIPVLGWDPT